MYKLQNDKDGNACAITILGTNLSIPFDKANTDYQAYLKHIAEGGEVLPADTMENT
jgi:hypothetical protein